MKVLIRHRKKTLSDGTVVEWRERLTPDGTWEIIDPDYVELDLAREDYNPANVLRG